MTQSPTSYQTCETGQDFLIFWQEKVQTHPNPLQKMDKNKKTKDQPTTKSLLRKQGLAQFEAHGLGANGSLFSRPMKVPIEEAYSSRIILQEYVYVYIYNYICILYMYIIYIYVYRKWSLANLEISGKMLKVCKV